MLAMRMSFVGSDCAGVEPPPTSESPSMSSSSTSPRRDFGREFAQEILGAAFYVAGGYANHPQRRDFVVGCAKVRAERGFERGDGELVDAESAEQRMAADARDDFFFSGDDAGLRPAEQFVAAEHHNVGAGFDAVADERLGDSGGGEIDEAAGAEVFDERQVGARA